MIDRAVNFICSLGVPGLVLLTAMAATGWVGGAAFTTAMAALGGPAGMVGGVLVLVGCGWISSALAKHGFEAVATSAIEKMVAEGTPREEIWKKVSNYKISRSLKDRLYRVLYPQP